MPMNSNPKSVAPWQWNTVRQVPSKICFTGGMTKKEHIVESMFVQQHEISEPQLFVKLHIKADWFLKMVGGPKMDPSMTKPITVIQRLQRLLDDATTGDDSTAAAIAGEEVDNDDPMSALAELRDPDPTPKKRKKVKKDPAAKHSIQPLWIKRHPFEDETISSKIMVYAMWQKRSLYLRADFIPWLVAYATDELNHQGVGGVEDVSYKAPNVPEIPNLCIEWDFIEHQYLAEFLEGPMKGVTRSLSLKHEVFQAKTPELQEMGAAPPLPYEEWSYKVKKKVATTFLTHWCGAVLAGDGGDFEHKFRVGAPSGADAGAMLWRRWGNAIAGLGRSIVGQSDAFAEKLKKRSQKVFFVFF